MKLHDNLELINSSNGLRIHSSKNDHFLGKTLPLNSQNLDPKLSAHISPGVGNLTNELYSSILSDENYSIVSPENDKFLFK